MRDFRDAKAMARTLRDTLATKAVAISHSESLELVSRMLGVADWNTLSAMLPDRRGLPGQPVVEEFSESDTKFFAKVVPAQLSFVTDASGRVTELILHQNGREQRAPRIDAAEADAKRVAREERFRSQVQDPRAEAVLRREIEALIANEPPDAKVMRPDMWAHINEVRPQGHATVAALGRLRSIDFAGVSQTGFDVYSVWYEDGVQRWSIRMGKDGLIEGIFFSIGP